MPPLRKAKMTRGIEGNISCLYLEINKWTNYGRERIVRDRLSEPQLQQNGKACKYLLYTQTSFFALCPVTLHYYNGRVIFNSRLSSGFVPDRQRNHHSHYRDSVFKWMQGFDHDGRHGHETSLINQRVPQDPTSSSLRCVMLGRVRHKLNWNLSRKMFFHNMGFPK